MRSSICAPRCQVRTIGPVRIFLLLPSGSNTQHATAHPIACLGKAMSFILGGLWGGFSASYSFRGDMKPPPLASLRPKPRRYPSRQVEANSVWSSSRI